jgi:ABC-type uncharacterized transport system permease subunit
MSGTMIDHLLLAEFVIALLAMAGLMIVSTKRWDYLSITLLTIVLVRAAIVALPLPVTVDRIAFGVAINLFLPGLSWEARRVWIERTHR